MWYSMLYCYSFCTWPFDLPLVPRVVVSHQCEYILLIFLWCCSIRVSSLSAFFCTSWWRCFSAWCFYFLFDFHSFWNINIYPSTDVSIFFNIMNVECWYPLFLLFLSLSFFHHPFLLSPSPSHPLLTEYLVLWHIHFSLSLSLFGIF